MAESGYYNPDLNLRVNVDDYNYYHYSPCLDRHCIYSLRSPTYYYMMQTSSISPVNYQ